MRIMDERKKYDQSPSNPVYHFLLQQKINQGADLNIQDNKRFLHLYEG